MTAGIRSSPAPHGSSICAHRQDASEHRATEPLSSGGQGHIAIRTLWLLFEDLGDDLQVDSRVNNGGRLLRVQHASLTCAQHPAGRMFIALHRGAAQGHHQNYVCDRFIGNPAVDIINHAIACIKDELKSST